MGGASGARGERGTGRSDAHHRRPVEADRRAAARSSESRRTVDAPPRPATPRSRRSRAAARASPGLLVDGSPMRRCRTRLQRPRLPSRDTAERRQRPTSRESHPERGGACSSPARDRVPPEPRRACGAARPRAPRSPPPPPPRLPRHPSPPRDGPAERREQGRRPGPDSPRAPQHRRRRGSAARASDSCGTSVADTPRARRRWKSPRSAADISSLWLWSFTRPADSPRRRRLLPVSARASASRRWSRARGAASAAR